MAEPTLQEIFGAGATQDANTITILKNQLPMTAALVNRGEQIFAAMFKKASLALTPEAFATNTDQSIAIAPGFDSLTYRTIGGLNATFLQTARTVNFAKEQANSGITPDDY
jgi:hypothetical protein